MSSAYLPLPDRAGGPATRNPLAAPLRGVLRIYNTAIGATAIAFLTAALYMFVVYHRTGLLPPSPPPPQPPFALEDTTLSNAVFSNIDSGDGECSPWFFYLVGGAGGAALIVSITGMSGLHEPNRRRLFLHILLLSGWILVHAAVLLLVFADPEWRARLPEDCTGFWAATQSFIDANAAFIKIAGLALIAAQLVCLGAACWLHSMYQAAYDDWIDGVEEQEARTMDHLGRAAEQAYAGSGPSVWRSRMSDKYGMSAGDWDREAAAAQQTAGLVDDGRS